MVKFQKWLHLFNQSLPDLHIDEFVEFSVGMEFNFENNILVTHVKGVKIHLDEKVLG